MNLLLVTARLAYEKIKSEFPNYDILKIPVDVASLIPPSILKKKIQNKKYDGIIIPGSIGYDVSKIENELGIPIRKGPIEISNLRYVLDNLKIDELSTKKPADEIIKIKKDNEISKIIEKAESIPLKRGIEIRGLKIGIDYPMRVMAEISNADKFKKEDLKSKIEYFKNSKADIIDLGFGIDSDYNKAMEIIEFAREKYSGILSVDSASEKILLNAQDAKCDLVLSLDENNYEISKSLDIPAVVIPKTTKGVINNPKDRINFLFDLIEKIDTNSIADPLLNPPLMNLVDSIEAYRLFREKEKYMPLFFGVGNVTELIDADSLGVNALLASIGQEIGVNILFTPEESRKCYKSVEELSIASKMMFISKNRPPKDLGIDLLRIKEKRAKKFYPTYAKDIIDIDKVKEPKIEKKMFFKIFIDEKFICATFFEKNKPKLTLRSSDPSKLYKKIIELNLVDSLTHSAYLGMEIQKAHIAIKINRSYKQEDEIF